MRFGLLVGDDYGADLEIADIDEHIVAINQAPLISARGSTQVILVIIHLIATIPVFVPDLLAFLPLVMLNVVVVISIMVILVPVLRECRSRKTCRQNS